MLEFKWPAISAVMKNYESEDKVYWQDLSTKVLFGVFEEGIWQGIPYDDEAKKYFRIRAVNVHEKFVGTAPDRVKNQDDFETYDLVTCDDNYLTSSFDKSFAKQDYGGGFACLQNEDVYLQNTKDERWKKKPHTFLKFVITQCSTAEGDKGCHESQDEIKKWLQTKIIIPFATNTKVDNSSRGKITTLQYEHTLHAIPLERSTYNDYNWVFRANSLSKQDDWYPAHPRKFDGFHEIIAHQHFDFYLKEDRRENGFLIAEIFVRLDNNMQANFRDVFTLKDWIGAVSGIQNFMMWIAGMFLAGWYSFGNKISVINDLFFENLPEKLQGEQTADDTKAFEQINNSRWHQFKIYFYQRCCDWYVGCCFPDNIKKDQELVTKLNSPVSGHFDLLGIIHDIRVLKIGQNKLDQQVNQLKSVNQEIDIKPPPSKLQPLEIEQDRNFKNLRQEVDRIRDRLPSTSERLDTSDIKNLKKILEDKNNDRRQVDNEHYGAVNNSYELDHDSMTGRQKADELDTGRRMMVPRTSILQNPMRDKEK